MKLRLLLSTALLGACASTPSGLPKGDPNDPSVKEQTAEKKQMLATEKMTSDYMRVLLRLDDAIESYVKLLANAGTTDQPKKLAQIERLIHDMVIGKDVNPKDNQGPIYGNYERLLATASDNSVPANQGIALAAIGFSGAKEALPVLVNGAMGSDPFLIDRAVFGLAILRDPRTPVGVLTRIMNDGTLAEESRAQAAWALVRLQDGLTDKTEITAVWRSVLAGDVGTTLSALLMNAVRGLGALRDKSHADLVAKVARHPAAKVREAVAIALGRMNAQEHVETLLAMLGNDETSPNVRLWASKALAQLAGGVDRGYDVNAWRQAFGRQPVPVQLPAPGTPDPGKK